MRKYFLHTAILGIAVVTSINAKPMPPFPVTRTQADGSTITIQLKGDEHLNYAQSTDGYLL
ncbi:MAG TPA: hypothetical protein VLM37_11030, partial [Fibrobacteraceae bacterium]|nr:hypothetical protein [Fibrobacteraceae bacterium]